ncbi:MAG: chorismate mutase [Planctomycetes bacterium]|nr:chorismate mutase [Planctomycetota bacterium]
MEDHEQLARWRAAMDVCNLRLAAVLHERARLVHTIGAWKHARGLPAVDPAREAEMLARILAAAPADGCPAACLREVFAAVFAAGRQIAGAAR